jgi:hypothetical protein
MEIVSKSTKAIARQMKSFDVAIAIAIATYCSGGSNRLCFESDDCYTAKSAYNVQIVRAIALFVGSSSIS